MALRGILAGRACSLLSTGILGAKRPDGGHVLTRATLALLRAAIARKHPRFARETPGYPLAVYGEQSRLTPATLARERSEEHTSELQSLMRISYAVFCLKKKITNIQDETADGVFAHLTIHRNTQ